MSCRISHVITAVPKTRPSSNLWPPRFCCGAGKAEVKRTPVRALRLCTGRTAHRGSRGIAHTFMTTALEGGKGSASRPGRSLSLGKTRYPLYRRLGGPQARSGQVRKISPSTGIWSPDRPARSQSLYWLCYLAHLRHLYRGINEFNLQHMNRTKLSH